MNKEQVKAKIKERLADGAEVATLDCTRSACCDYCGTYNVYGGRMVRVKYEVSDWFFHESCFGEITALKTRD